MGGRAARHPSALFVFLPFLCFLKVDIVGGDKKQEQGGGSSDAAALRQFLKIDLTVREEIKVRILFHLSVLLSYLFFLLFFLRTDYPFKEEERPQATVPNLLFFNVFFVLFVKYLT